MNISAEITLHDGTVVTFTELSNGVTKQFSIVFTRCVESEAHFMDNTFKVLLQGNDAEKLQRALSFIGVIE